MIWPLHLLSKYGRSITVAVTLFVSCFAGYAYYVVLAKKNSFISYCFYHWGWSEPPRIGGYSVYLDRDWGPIFAEPSQQNAGVNEQVVFADIGKTSPGEYTYVTILKMKTLIPDSGLEPEERLGTFNVRFLDTTIVNNEIELAWLPNYSLYVRSNRRESIRDALTKMTISTPK